MCKCRALINWNLIKKLLVEAISSSSHQRILQAQSYISCRTIRFCRSTGIPGGAGWARGARTSRTTRITGPQGATRSAGERCEFLFYSDILQFCEMSAYQMLFICSWHVICICLAVWCDSLRIVFQLTCSVSNHDMNLSELIVEA